MVLQNISLIFVGKITNMAKHELTEKQIAALQKLGVMPSRFYKTHIPINNNNVFFNGRTNWKKLGIAIAVDVYTSVEGIKRKRYCFDCVRNNLSDNYTESNIRQLDKFVTHYLNILLNPCPSVTILSKMMTTNMD